MARNSELIQDIRFTYPSGEPPGVNRREALRAGGAGLTALVALSGCSSGSDGTGSRTDHGTPTPGGGADTATSPMPTATPGTAARTPTPGVDFGARFRVFLEAEGVPVRELDEAGPIVTLRYVTESTSYEAVSEGIGRVSGGFFHQVRDGWDVTRLESTVVDTAGTPLATWYARAAWFREFRDGGITADELSLRVLRTVERTGATGTETAGTSG